MSRRLSSLVVVALGFGLLVACVPFIADRLVAAKYGPQIVFDSVSWRDAPLSHNELSPRQLMIRDLATRVLPGKSRSEIESALGSSRSHEQMRRYSAADLQIREKDIDGNWKPFPRSGAGHYYDQYHWDLIYPIGYEQILIFDHKGQELSPDEEHLMVRFDANGMFASWYIDGSTRWPKVVGDAATKTYRQSR